MEETWRWFGPEDAIRLTDVRQTGARGIVTALHQIPYGEVWSLDAIRTRKAMIEADQSLGLRWSVVESLPIHERIKLDEGDLKPLFDNYRASLRNLAACGVKTLCYNFMPVLDWTRTELAAPTPGGGTSLRFNAEEFAAFDCFILEREGAEADHGLDVLGRAHAWMKRSSQSDRDKLLANIMAGLPGAFDRYDVPGLRDMLKRYRNVSAKELRERMARFLREVVPTAEEVGIRMAIHPDDPPRPLFGLPRVVSTAADLAFVVDAVKSPSNGITLCTGSLGAGPANDLVAIATRFAPHVHFAHLRNVRKEPDGSFQESDHLDGDVDLPRVIAILLAEEKRRSKADANATPIPFRPDHGHQIADDLNRPTHPGYPLIGRLRGLAEIRGVIRGLEAGA